MCNTECQKLSECLNDWLLNWVIHYLNNNYVNFRQCVTFTIHKLKTNKQSNKVKYSTCCYLLLCCVCALTVSWSNYLYLLCVFLKCCCCGGNSTETISTQMRPSPGFKQRMRQVTMTKQNNGSVFVFFWVEVSISIKPNPRSYNSNWRQTSLCQVDGCLFANTSVGTSDDHSFAI